MRAALHQHVSGRRLFEREGLEDDRLDLARRQQRQCIVLDRSRSNAAKGAIARAVEDNALPLLAAGKIKPVIFKTFPLKEAAAAHVLMESSAHIGKIVLTL